MKRKVTIRDVAQEAGVSLGTASRALNRTGRVSEATIAAVTKVARRLGYEPDVVARSLRTRSSGVVKIVKDIDIELEDYDVLLVEDILDSGRTLSYVCDMLRTRHPASIRVATLLDKPERRVVDLKADYVGTSVPDEFVVGYGLDFDQRYRNLPYIGQLKRSVYEK